MHVIQYFPRKFHVPIRTQSQEEINDRIEVSMFYFWSLQAILRPILHPDPMLISFIFPSFLFWFPTSLKERFLGRTAKGSENV